MDPRLDLRIGVGLMLHRVKLSERVKHLPPRRLADAGRIVEEQYRRTAGAESDALITRGQEAARPESREQRLVSIDGMRLREQDDKRREILVLAAKSIAEPRAHARSPRPLE